MDDKEKPEGTPSAGDSADTNPNPLLAAGGNAEGGAEGADGSPGAPDGTPAGGADAAEEAGGSGDGATPTPASPTGADLLKLVAGDEDAQRIVQQRLAEGVENAQAEALSKQEAAEVAKLVEGEQWEELGKRFVRKQESDSSLAAANDVALRTVYGELYRRLFSHPAVQQLSAADREQLNPQRFATDTEYVLALTQTIARFEEGQQRTEAVQQQVNETLETLKNMQSAGAATGASISGLPRATGDAASPKSSGQLIAEGWADQLGQAGET